MKNFSDLKKLIFVIFTIGATTTQGIASEALLEGVRPFICNGSAVVLLKTETGWVNPSDPSTELTRIKTGWRMEDPLSGQVAYLTEENRNSWSIEVLSEEGYAKIDCMDIADSVSDVVTIIKPKLDQNISQTQEDLNSVKEHLMESVVEISELTSENEKVLENLNKTKVTLEAKNNEYDQKQKELIFVKKQFRDSLSEISELKLENEKVLESLNKTKATLEAKHNEYIALRSFVTQNPSGALLVLNELLTMSPSERNQAIRKSTLGTKALNQSGMLPTCVKILRDKAKMSSGCKDRITDFLVVEGW
ncbi:hypothetical protein N9X02_03655 [Planktomarina temperata]|nr:hypothetical protein [Planktomarina temperata]MDB4091597.1 hypothetical protein [bacterium]